MTQTQNTMEPGKVYSLFNASGKIEEIKPLSDLPLYCKVYCYGYGMSEREGAIISGKDQHGSYKVVYISDYEPGFTTLDSYSRPHSKKFGIGIYYSDNFETWDETTVKEYIVKAEAATIARKEADRLQSEKDSNEIENLPKLFPHLTVNKQGEAKTTKGNLVAELKKNYPGIKFSVRKEHHSTYNIEWTDGPTHDEINKISGQFEDHASDITGDYHDYCPSNFNRVFGGFSYIFERRNFSDGLNNLKNEAAEILQAANRSEIYPEQFLRQIISRYSLPAGAEIIGLQRNDRTSASDYSDFFDLLYTETITKEENDVIRGIYSQFGEVEIIDYSDKAFAVCGNTKPIKEQLKALGGRFNPRLTCGPGWIFSKTRLEAVKVHLSL